MFIHADKKAEAAKAPPARGLEAAPRSQPNKLGAMGFDAAAAALAPPGAAPKGKVEGKSASLPADQAPPLPGMKPDPKMAAAQSKVETMARQTHGPAQVLERAPASVGPEVMTAPPSANAPAAAPKSQVSPGGSAKAQMERETAAREAMRKKQVEAASKLTAAERAKALGDVLTTTAGLVPGAAALGALVLAAAGPAGWLAAAGLAASATAVATGLTGLVMSGWWVTSAMQLGLTRLNAAISRTRGFESPAVLSDLPALAVSPATVKAGAGDNPVAALKAHRESLCAYRLKVRGASEQLAASAVTSQDSIQHATKLAGDVVKFVSAGGLPFLMLRLFRNALPPGIFGSAQDPAESYNRHGEDQWSARDVLMASSSGELAHARSLVSILDSVAAYVETLINEFSAAIEAEGGKSESGKSGALAQVGEREPQRAGLVEERHQGRGEARDRGLRAVDA